MRNNKLTAADTYELAKAFNSALKLNNNVMADMLPQWEIISTKRKQILTAAGDIERYLYFVTEGVQRCYSVYGDKDATIVFSYSFSFAGVIDSFLLQQSSAYYFETLTASRLLRISYVDFMAVVNKHPIMEKVLRIQLSYVVSGILQRQTELAIYSAADKLEAVYKRSSHIFNLIPHKYIASYIGVDAATFSKLLAKQTTVK